MNYSKGKTYLIKQYNPSSNRVEAMEATIVNFVKKIQGRNVVEFKVNGKIKKLATNVFKSKVL